MSIITCNECGIQYGYGHGERKYFLDYKKTVTPVCRDCFSESRDEHKFCFVNHIPNYCDGGVVVRRMFDKKESLLKWLEATFDDDNIILCQDKDGCVMTVNKNKVHWWVEGGTNVSIDELPYWKNVVKEIHGIQA